MSITIRNAVLAEAPDTRLDLAITNGRIAAVGTNLTPAEEDIDLGGRLIVPGFVETHIHLDKACILDRCTICRGDIQEAIQQVASVKAGFTEDDVYRRASDTLAKSVARGTMRMRTHVEIDPVIGLRGFHGVRRAIADYKWAMDAEICVFPQEGLLNNPGTDALLRQALEEGAEVLGAAPYVDTDSKGQIDWTFDTAREFDVDIDMHLDFGSDTSMMDVDHVCRRTEEYGWGGRVTIGHVTKFSYLPRAQLAMLAKRLADCGVAVTVLPSTDLFLMGRDHDHAVPRGVVPAHELLTYGVNCSLSTNNVMNPFTPYGDCSLVRMANLYANIAQIGVAEQMAECMAMITNRSAKLLNLPDYGLEVGRPADFVALDAFSPASAVAEIAQPIMGYKRGRRSFTHPLPQLHRP
ncbi:amidohydrolase family protein [Falsirhodobacter sp. alg1]|uniref:amidohydrolase family protein n=1 Tax=Falsirhodobacter sp. alg1 TaxID=1472418 RepID=UPI0005F053EC|nr:amidohydrolase family protein [Falsirhodobacter sp. alg1]